MPSQKLITIAVYAAVATSLGSATQADIQVHDFAVHARFDLTDPRGGPFPSDRFTEFDASQPHGTPCQPPITRLQHAPRRLCRHRDHQYAGRFQPPAADRDSL